MERKCRVCGSDMRRTNVGYKCSFCANVELLNSNQAVYTTAQSNVKGEKKKTLVVPIVIGVLAVLPFLILGLIMLPLYLGSVKDTVNMTSKADSEYDANWNNEETKGSQVPKEVDGFQSSTMQLLLSQMFGKPADEVTKEELASIQYLKVDSSWETCEISYSTEDYHEYEPNYWEKIKGYYEEASFAYNEDFLETIQTITIGDRDGLDRDFYKELDVFQNVKALNLDNYDYSDLSALPYLSMVNCNGANISELLEANLPIEQIEVLKDPGSDLTGIGDFTSLEKLYLERNDVTQLGELAECAKLDTLYCMNLDNDMSYEPLKPLKNLKTLYIDGSSEGVKDLSVIASFSELENLTITDTDILNIDFVKDLDNLKTFRLSENGKLEKFEALGELTGLEYLEFNISCLHGNQPKYEEIGKLKNLKALTLHTVYNLDFLYELEQLEELEIQLTFYNYLLKPIYKMSNLRSLTLSQCNSQYEEGFVGLSQLSELKTLTINQMEFDDPMDGLFTLDTLEELHITHSKFYMPPNEVTVSDNLKVLDLSYTDFITMPGYGEYRYVGYEDEAVAQSVLQNYFSATALEELYLDYYLIGDLSGLNNLSNLKVLSLQRCDLTEIAETDLSGCTLLEELYLSKNQISNINFAKNLPNLKHIELEDCYVTDLTPLQDCAKLQYVNAKNNPITVNPLTNVEVHIK